MDEDLAYVFDLLNLGRHFFRVSPLELIVAAVELTDDEIASRGFVYARGAGAQS